MSSEGKKRTVAFFDGQNLYHSARSAFGFSWPNFDPIALAESVCRAKGWHLSGTRFYTGVPDAADDAFWHQFWVNKLAMLSRRGVHVFRRSLRYRKHHVPLPNGKRHSFVVPEEKGIDVRLAIDIIRLAHRQQYDVALVFSQDQDLSEAADEIRQIAREQGRWIKIASAFPVAPGISNRRGIDKTDWIPIPETQYRACIDPRDYRSRRS